jgi:hypothetical protein
MNVAIVSKSKNAVDAHIEGMYDSGYAEDARGGDGLFDRHLVLLDAFNLHQLISCYTVQTRCLEYLKFRIWLYALITTSTTADSLKL